MKKEGAFAVIRDSQGRIVHKQLDQGRPKHNWRHYARLQTNNGMDMFEALVRIARGEALQTSIKLPTGETVMSEPQVPPAAVQMQAAKEVFELIHGKAVAATEVIKAEEESQQLERIRSLSDRELLALLDETGEVTDGEIVEDPALPPSTATAPPEVLQYDPEEP